MAVSAEVRRNATLVLVAGGVYLTLQALLTGFALPLHPYERALFDGLLTEDLWVLRLAMMLVSTGALVLAFRSWVRPAGKAAWAGAGFVAVAWAPVHYGPQARPEVLLLFAAVAATGYATRWLVERDRGALVGVAVATTVAMVCDPFLGLALAVGLTAVVLVWARMQSGLALLALGAGLVVGRALASVARVVLADGAAVASAASSDADDAAGLLHLLEPLEAGGAVGRAAAGAVVVLGLIVLGMFWQRWPHRHNAARVGVAVAAVVLLASAAAGGALPQMLPVLGVAAIAVGAGLLAAWRTSRETGWFLATIAYVGVVAAFVGWQGWVAAAAA